MKNKKKIFIAIWDYLWPEFVGFIHAGWLLFVSSSSAQISMGGRLNLDGGTLTLDGGTHSPASPLQFKYCLYLKKTKTSRYCVNPFLVSQNYDYLPSSLSACKTKGMVNQEWKWIADFIDFTDDNFFSVEEIKLLWFDLKKFISKKKT